MSSFIFHHTQRQKSHHFLYFSAPTNILESPCPRRRALAEAVLVQDVATLSQESLMLLQSQIDHDSSKARTQDMGSSASSCGPQHLAAPQDYTGVLNMTVAQAGKPGMIGHPIYSPYGTEQSLGQWSNAGPAQYPAPHHLNTDYTTQAVHHGYHHANMAEWSQYPLFSYSCW